MVKELGKVILRLTQTGMFVLCGATTMGVFTAAGWIFYSIAVAPPYPVGYIVLAVLAYTVGKVAYEGFD
jgi:hypothetical protein